MLHNCFPVTELCAIYNTQYTQHFEKETRCISKSSLTYSKLFIFSARHIQTQVMSKSTEKRGQFKKRNSVSVGLNWPEFMGTFRKMMHPNWIVFKHSMLYGPYGPYGSTRLIVVQIQ